MINVSKFLIALVTLTLFAMMPLHASATEVMAEDPGEVRVPLAEYLAMLALTQQQQRPAPASYAIGKSNVIVTVDDRDGGYAATAQVTMLIETFEDQWTLVPVLPNGAALKSALVNGRPVQLVRTADGLALSTNRAATVALELRYGLDARKSDSGFVLPVPLPGAASTGFQLVFPDSDVDLAVIPSTDFQQVDTTSGSMFTATIPATSSVLISWRAQSQNPYAISRATYSGELLEDALEWTAEFQVELFGTDLVTLPVMPSSITLSDIRVDGKPVTVIEENGQFVTPVRGQGAHKVQVRFQTPVTTRGGPPQSRLDIPRVPVSRLDLKLPSNKVLKIGSGANVVTREQGEFSLSTVFIPMSNRVQLSWTEAVPEDLKAEVRANTSLFHILHAEEGVLHADATIVYEITHGETSLLELEIPEDAEVNRITSPAGGALDWAVTEGGSPGTKRIGVFLQLPVSGEYVLNVSYERLLGAGPDALEKLSAPLLRASNVHRQRGMVALLASPELTLNPVEDEGLSRVGENQLPNFIRERIELTVAHTYKYSGVPSDLTVEVARPERRIGKFNAQVDTLISLGDVTMKGSATVEIDVKSGSISELALRLPGNVNVLGVSSPSLRTHQVREIADGQAIDLEFTREMEGLFRVEVNYERIMQNDAAEVTVPTVAVPDAEVEHGRIAVEALTAVEVRTAATERLSNLDINELPRQLVLKTSNPILHGFRYVNAKPSFKLALKITRHREIDVQVAAIDRAHYTSLFTRDGLSVTSARLIVRNSRRQFLRLALPDDSEVWSVFVDGKPVKPAMAGTAGAPEVLIKMINSARGFPVDIVYATPVGTIEHTGTLSSHLPRPDMVTTQTRWDVFLPIDARYYRPDSTMDVVVDGVWADPRVMAAEMKRRADASKVQMGQPLRINVPTRGIQYSFEKLYANQSNEAASFAIRYVSSYVDTFGIALSVLGTVLIWVAIGGLASRKLGISQRGVIAAMVASVALLAGSFGYLGTNPVPASVLALLIAIALGAWWSAARIQAWRDGSAA